VTAHSLAQRAYGEHRAPARSARRTEFDLLAATTGRLRRAAETDDRFPALVAALHDNRALWTAFAADVAGSGNALPPGLRAQVLYLAEFTRQHSAKVLRGEAAADPLIDINTAVMRGLGQAGGPS